MAAFLPAILWTVVVFLLLLAVGLCGELRRLEHQRTGASELPPNTKAPRFTATEAVSGRHFDSHTLKGKEHLLLFVSPSCGLCRLLMGEMRDIRERDLLVVCRNTDDDCSVFAPNVATLTVLLDDAGQIADLYGALSLPALVVINRNHRIRGYAYPKRYGDIREHLDRAATSEDDLRHQVQTELQQ